MCGHTQPILLTSGVLAPDSFPFPTSIASAFPIPLFNLYFRLRMYSRELLMHMKHWRSCCHGKAFALGGRNEGRMEPGWASINENKIA